MKRFHVNVAVSDLQKSRQFYRELFAAEPTVSKADYAKWMLEDPRINFSISQSNSKRGIQHLGLQADSMDELAEIRQRLVSAGRPTVDQPETECCYARSSKAWVRDPDEVSWETFVTHGQITHYGADIAELSERPATRVPLPDAAETAGKRCCA